MKKISFILAILIAVFFTACNKDNVEPTDDNIIPERFSVEIPSSLNHSNVKVTKSASDDVLSGNEIYNYLTAFIHVGDEAAEIISSIISSIRLYGLSEPMSFTYDGEDDGRTKNVVIIADSEYEGVVWNYQMTITDADSEGNDDGGIAMQIFWNTGTIKGISILKPYNINRNDQSDIANAMFRIDYNEDQSNGYEQEMTVYISGITLPNPLTNPFAVETLKMTVGKKGNIVEVFGNTNHPNAAFFTTYTGFNWAFVAAGETDTDIGVAEVGLPPSDLNSSSRVEILETYSIKNVFTEQIYTVWPGISQDLVDNYLQNTEAPGYFNANGFVAGGTSPGTEYDAIDAAIDGLVPFNPYEVTNLNVVFKTNAVK